MINTIIIDLDGTILDGKLRHYRCYSDILSEKGFVPMPIDRYWDMKRNRIDRRGKLSISGADGIYDEFLKAWMERIEERDYLVFDRMQPGAVQKLKEWKSAGIKLVLVTMRNNKNNLDWQLNRFGLLPLFTDVIALGTEGGEERKAGAIRKYIEDVTSGSSLWIGDTEVDIRAARLLGVKICAVGCGLRIPDYLATLKPDFLVPDLKDINLHEMRL